MSISRPFIYTFQLLVLGVFAASTAIAQSGAGKVIYPDRSGACDSEATYTLVKQMPEYKGGLKQLERDLQEHLVFSSDLKGTSFIQLLIDCKGRVASASTLHGFSDDFEKQLKQVLNTLQNWNPGLQQGVGVDVFVIVEVKVRKGMVEVRC